ncbi:hypothetical protein DsansV1_C38g0235811 [Dioscorea sansibarensis]
MYKLKKDFYHETRIITLFTFGKCKTTPVIRSFTRLNTLTTYSLQPRTCK